MVKEISIRNQIIQTGADKEAEEVRDEQDINNQVGRKASFILRITSRQYATWQGSISWTERGITKHFRSALELLKLIASALEDDEEEAVNDS